VPRIKIGGHVTMRRKAGTSAGANESKVAPDDASIVLRVPQGSSDHLAVELERGDEMQLSFSSGRLIDVFLYAEADYHAASKGRSWPSVAAIQQFRATTATRLTFRTSATGWFYVVFDALSQSRLRSGLDRLASDLDPNNLCASCRAELACKYALGSKVGLDSSHTEHLSGPARHRPIGS
jgi:hypothetical protein